MPRPMLIELARYPEARRPARAANCPHVLPGVSTIHLYEHLRASRRADRRPCRPPDATSRSPATRRAASSDAQYAIDLAHGRDRDRAVGRRSGRRRARSRVKGSTGSSTSTTRSSSASWRSRRCTPRPTSRSGPGRRATSRRPTRPPSTARTVIERYRAVDRTADRTGRARHPARSAGGWRSARPSYARAAGEDDPAPMAGRPPGARGTPRPVPRGLRRCGGRPRRSPAGRDRCRRRTVARGPRDRDQDRRRRCSSAGIDATASPIARRPSRRRPARARRARPTSAIVEPADPFGLTSREREVLGLVAEGYTNRRIAETLFISESTAGVHVSNILGKLGVATRTEAAAVAVRLGLDRARPRRSAVGAGRPSSGARSPAGPAPVTRGAGSAAPP